MSELIPKPADVEKEIEETKNYLISLRRLLRVSVALHGDGGVKEEEDSK